MSKSFEFDGSAIKTEIECYDDSSEDFFHAKCARKVKKIKASIQSKQQYDIEREYGSKGSVQITLFFWWRNQYTSRVFGTIK